MNRWIHSFLGANYHAGYDAAVGRDYSVFVLMRRPNKLERLLRWLRLSKAVWEWKVVDEQFGGKKEIRPLYYGEDSR